MIHYGDITKINGYDVPIVDIITGGSPCQDLSQANSNRKGLQGERSALFMEQIRIVKELHDECRRTNQPIRPRYMVWENVPGALSSNGGNDFRAVLEETIRIADSRAVIPGLADGQTWNNAGCILGDRFSVAWRIHDSQFWGVPQRRRRIALVADFRGQAAPEILFERKSLSGNFGEGEQGREKLPPDTRTSVDPTGKSIIFRKTAHPRNSKEAQGYEQAEISDTLNSFDLGESRTPTIIFDWHRQDTRITELGDVCVTMASNWGQGGNNTPYVLKNSVLRRLTPIEAERLQGFPDNWTKIGEWVDSKGKKHREADSPRFRALGNSLALPFWEWLAGKIVAQLKADGVEKPTMASLFDGIGGFPLVFSRCGCNPVWASEIEEFPIAVTKYHFGCKEEGIEGDIEKYLDRPSF